MTNDYIVVLTTTIGVSGPVLTLVITNHFQDKQKAREHNNSLQAIWFTKKLNAAEVIIAQNALFLAGIFSINIAIKNLKLGDNELSYKKANLMSSSICKTKLGRD